MVGFGFGVSGFGFRSLKPCNFSSRFRVSGFGRSSGSQVFRVGFGFRVSGFGFRSSKPTLALGFGFRVSQLETFSGFGFRVSGFDRSWGSQVFRVGFGFRVSADPQEANYKSL